ncbi:hypothetical protein [Peribacillus kribbensis]|uniref:hypothetical protein n=1 Tax=Peribacillus kribbensis TaxID=356658 RepID=UPI000406759F|nr:hypothetical protein [Peribacillus kribbensis]
MIHRDSQFDLQPLHGDTYTAKDEKGNTTFTIGFPTPAAEEAEKCIVVNSKACPEFVQTYSAIPADRTEFDGRYSDGVDSYEVRIEEESLLIKDTVMNKEITGTAIEKKPIPDSRIWPGRLYFHSRRNRSGI